MKIAFLDRDGTLIYEPQETYQINAVEEIVVLEGVMRGLKELSAAGYMLVMFTNQDGLGSTDYPQATFDTVQDEIFNLLAQEGIAFSKVFVCPHTATDGCDCRKPKTGLVDSFITANTIDLTTSFVCGDRAADEGLAKNLGVRFVKMQTNGNFYEVIKGVI